MFDSWTTDRGPPPHVSSLPRFVMLRFRDTGRRGIDRVERSGVEAGAGSD